MREATIQSATRNSAGAGLYDNAFFDTQDQDAMSSAAIVAPIVIQFVKPASVVDIGCGRGAWLQEFKKRGATTVLGMDGTYVDPNRLLIETSEFQGVDLSEPFSIRGGFDLAVCLEVAEHLPPRMGPFLVDALTAAAPIVLFSAAIPNQGGTNHINERLPAYWEGLFSKQGFERADCIRPIIWQDSRIKDYYRQNLLLYCSKRALVGSKLLQGEVERSRSSELELIHREHLARLEWFTKLLTVISRVAMRGLRRRILGRAPWD